jgi:hypothetical protein
MHELPEAEGADRPGDSPSDENLWRPSAEQDAWMRDAVWSQYALEDGLFRKYHGKIVAVYQQKVVGTGTNPLHMRRRISKKLGIDGLRVILVDTLSGVL